MPLYCQASLGKTKVYFALENQQKLYDLPNILDVYWDCCGEIIPVTVYSAQLRDIEEEKTDGRR